jgi:tetratricopeptide (TPR) repeat protein
MVRNARGYAPWALLAPGLAICASFAAASCARAVEAVEPQRIGADPLAAAVHETYRLIYSLDHDDALASARALVVRWGSEPVAHRTLASVIWLRLLFLRGTVSVDHYLGGVARSDVTMPKPPADIDRGFRDALGQALALAEARQRAAPEDLQARFDVGAAYGLQASYAASIEGRITAAFGAARKAYDLQEEVLARDASRTNAGVVVGTYRYLVASMGLPKRLIAYMAGFGGDKEKGIALLVAARSHPESRVDATTALMIIYSREGRHAEVVRLAREMRAEFPRNRLLYLEEGAAAIRVGAAADAEAVLTRGLEAFAADPRTKVPGEKALWLYKRGLSRVNLNKPAAADVDLKQALGENPAGWVRGRIHTELGRIADLAGRRAEALSAYRLARTLAETSRDAAGLSAAERGLRRPFAFDR